MKTIIPLFVVAVLIVHLPQAQAISPTPDGCYPNFTTAEGCKALNSLTTGAGNTALGWYSLFGNSTGSFNTAVGAGALDLNTADNNTAIGVAALLLNTTGTGNTANGVDALVFNDTGSLNTANGAFALLNNTTAVNNTATGYAALYSNTTGTENTAIGVQALYFNTASGNTAAGAFALLQNTTGVNNVANGDGALQNNTTGSDNTATGYQALSSNIDASGDTANGSQALLNNTNGSQDTATGAQALFFNTTGFNNTAVGSGALFSNTAGHDNTAVGTNALGSSTGNFNIALGDLAGNDVTTAGNVICIGADVRGANVSNSCYIGNIFNATSSGGLGVLVNADGKLGTTTSSRRFKDDIKSMDHASEAILALKPVTFHYKKEIDPAGMSQFGLVAEDVEKVNPDLIVRDKEGKPYSVRYDQVNAMLLNEFLKEHHKVQELEVTVAQQRQEMKAVIARLDEHDSRIQRVSDHLELSKPAPRTVLNNQ